ncbi:unnamed protein product [Rotaria sordida]|nr:unnamed protein product [Rotaria sordida]CAF4003438.1 unnamed protein product [Rotaria sordida]CAF4019172.1 unnamed protein product [Rotaria sordida]CAF4055191.1 unnamed protein product [Rotaria sordida]
MAEALSSSFDQWIRSLLNELQSNDADMSDFVQYLMGIVTSDSETDEEKKVAIAELLADLDLKHDHNIDNLSQQILDRWYQLQNTNDHNSNSNRNHTGINKDDDAINNALINAMNQMESTIKQQKQNNDHNSNKFHDDIALKKHKSQVLAKYSEISDEEIDYGIEHETNDNDLFQNTNAQVIEDREKKTRELQHETHKKQQEKNKIDANSQKQKDDERKKKAQQRAQKQERRR